MSQLAVPKGKRVKKPLRDPDMHSKRGIPYWFGPDWVRDTNGTVGRIVPVKNKYGGVDLWGVAKNGNASYIQGSIQKEFHDWHQNEQVDAILFGIEESEILATSWEYE